MTNYPAAQQFPGPAEKQGYPGYANRNAIAGLCLHSMDGNWATGGVNVLANSGQSWHFSILRDGTVLQHYPLEAQCYHSGVAQVNRKTIGIEHEGYHSPEYGHGVEALTEAQIAASVKLCRWIADIPVAWPIVRGQTLFLHHDLGTSECPGTRFDNIIDRWTGAAMPTATAIAPNTNVSSGPWDIGAERIDDEASLEAEARRHKKHAGTLENAIAAVQRGYAS